MKDIIQRTPHPGPPDDAYTPTCVFLLLLFRKGTPHILTIQKSDTSGYPWRNQVALPGGHVDPSDATALDAAYREVNEELGIPRDRIDLVGRMGHFQTINRKDIQVFIGVWDGRGPIKADPTEVARVMEIPLAEVVRHHRFEKEPVDPVYPFADVRIWGATARILHYFVELVYPVIENGALLVKPIEISFDQADDGGENDTAAEHRQQNGDP